MSDAPADAVLGLVQDLGAALRRAHDGGATTEITITLKARRKSDKHRLGQIRASIDYDCKLKFAVGAEPTPTRARWDFRLHGPNNPYGEDVEASTFAGAVQALFNAAHPSDLSGRDDILLISSVPFHIRARLSSDLVVVSSPEAMNELEYIALAEGGRLFSWSWHLPGSATFYKGAGGKVPLRRYKTQEAVAAHLARGWLRANARILTAHQRAAYRAGIVRIAAQGFAPVIPIDGGFRR